MVILLLSGFFIGVSLLGTSSHHSAADVLPIALLYTCLAAVLHLGSLQLMRCHAVAGFFASLALGSIVVWHLHEQTRLPAGKVALLIATLLVGSLEFQLLRSASRVDGPKGAWRKLVLASACFAAVLVAGFHQSSTLRWHILRHHKLIGTPAYYLLAAPMPEVEGRLFVTRESSGEPPRRGALPGSTGAPQPNLLFIMIDTLRADALSVYGGDPGLMPKLNRLASGSVVFTDVMANSSWTRPSVASFFTGRLPEEHGAVDRGDALSRDELTLAEVLGAAGYRSAAFVTNFAQVGRSTGFDQGFDHFAELRDEGLAYARADDVTRAVARHLSELRSGENAPSAGPLFLYVHLLDPHLPYLSGGGDSVIPAVARRAYDAELTFLDGELARLLDLVGSLLPGPTVTLITSDHGEEFGEHGGDYLRHGHSLYAELLSIPVILRTPGGGRGEVGAPLEARDVFDLLIALAGEPEMDVGVWAEARRRHERHASVYLTSDLPLDRPYLRRVIMRGVEKEGFFLVWSGYGETHELYEMKSDPGQRVNLVRRHPELTRELSRSIASSPRPWHAGGMASPSEASQEQLRSLGYAR